MNNSQSSYRPMTSPLFSRDMFQFRSLPRRSRLLSLPGSPVGPELNLDCECPYNRSNGLKTRDKTSVLRSSSAQIVRPEASLNEVVEKFEEVLRDQRNRLFNRSKKLPDVKSATVSRMSSISDFEHGDSYQNQNSSPTLKSPLFGLNAFPRSRREENQCDGKYKAFALMRQNTLPLNAKLQDKDVIAEDALDKFKESSFIVKRNASWCGSRRSDFVNLSPYVSPTDGTHDVFGSFVESTSTATTRSTSADSAVLGSKESNYELAEGITTNSNKKSSSSVRSIGISTNFAPSLMRKTPPKMLYESMTRSTSTQKVATSDSMCQAVPGSCSRGTETNFILIPVITSRNVGISVRPDPGYNESTQTCKVKTCDEAVQVSEKCVTCGVKQTETIGVGESNFKTSDIAVGPDDDMFERIRKERQLQREIDSVYEAKPAFVCDSSSLDRESSSPNPTAMSKIPRLQPVCDTSGGRIVIEETCNEILVYRRPESVEETVPGKHRAFLPQMIAEESQHLISACKIEDDGEEEVMSESSDEEDSVVVREIPMRQPTKRYVIKL